MSTPDSSDALHAARLRRRGVRSALLAVESACASSSGDANWTKVLHERLQALQLAFDHHISVTEGDGGLFDETIEVAPRLAHRVEALRVDHVEIGELLARAVVGVPASVDPNDADAVAAVRAAVTQVMGRITRHRQLGADLVYEAYTVDIEGGD